MSLRISGGAWRGRGLASAPASRPTQERVREALFSSWGPRVPGARVLDLFAGSGCVGLEALSRGAESCCFVESREVAVRAIIQNAGAVGISEPALARFELPAGLSRLPGGWPTQYDLVFADPPYDFADYETLLTAIEPLLAAGAEVAVEHSVRRTLAPAGLVVVRERRYGESALTFLRAEVDT